jgi:hypothetical protein
MIKSKMSEPLSQKVDLNSETECFMDLVAHAMKILVGGVLERLESAFRMMNGTNWASDSQVGEESAYVLQINNTLLEAVPKIRETLASTYFNTFCTKVATEILHKYQDIIMKQRKISEMGSQQLLLDTYSMKTLLLHVHSLGASNENKTAPPMMFSKLVTNQSNQIETILKLVGTHEELLLERYKIMVPEGRMDELLSIMNLKGMKRPEMQAVLDRASAHFGSSFTNSSSNKGATYTQATAGSSSSGLSIPIVAGAALPTGAAISSATVAMRNLTSNISSSAQSAVGSLKWGK